jgi:hypothetical protein
MAAGIIRITYRRFFGEGGQSLNLCNPANDNIKGPWPLIPFPEGTPSTVADAIQPRTLKGIVALVAYGIVASIATISWFYLIGMTLLGAVEWALE